MTDPAPVYPALPRIADFPLAVGAALTVLFTSILLFIAARYDPTQGTLTLSLMITLGMLGAVGYCLIFTIPADDITPGIVGGLTAGFGAVVAHWLGRVQGGKNHD